MQHLFEWIRCGLGMAAAFLIFSGYVLLFGLFWGIPGYVIFRLARRDDRRWPVGASLTALVATAARLAPMLFGYYVLAHSGTQSDLEDARLAMIFESVVEAVGAFAGFALARMVLRRRLAIVSPGAD